MGIFTRLRDIISSNINAMLDKAEDPEKLVRLMIQEMEDTLVEIKASCAGVMAARKRVRRALEEVRARGDQWGDNARIAVVREREDLAREALVEKRRARERADQLERELIQCDALIEQYHADIIQLEDKLNTARERQRSLVQRHLHARQKKRTQQEIRRLETSEALIRFEQFENRIERLEAEADLVDFGRRPMVAQEFARLEDAEEIEKELQALKASVGEKGRGGSFS